MTHSLRLRPHIPTNCRYANGFRWCGKCGEWYKMKHPEIAFQRCPYCNYVLRLDALLKGKRRPEEVHRY